MRCRSYGQRPNARKRASPIRKPRQAEKATYLKLETADGLSVRVSSTTAATSADMMTAEHDRQHGRVERFLHRHGLLAPYGQSSRCHWCRRGVVAMCCGAARDPATIARRGGVAGAGERAAASLTAFCLRQSPHSVRPGLALN